jgi:integrase
MTRRSGMPPGARWVDLPSGARRVELVTETGTDPRTGRRRQTRRRFRTVKEASDAYLEIAAAARLGRYVARSSVTVKELSDDWIASRHGLRATTVAGYRQVLKPAVDAFGNLPASRLEKRHVVYLVKELQRGFGSRADGKPRKPWRPRSLNLMLFVLGSVLGDAVAQGVLTRNVVALVDRVPSQRKEMATFTEDEVRLLLKSVFDTEMEHVWHLALYGLRRGELAGLRWEDVDDVEGVLQICRTRVAVDGHAQISLPKTATSGRTLPVSSDLRAVLARARARQARDAELAGAAYAASGFVAVDKLGGALHPETLSDRWDHALAAAGVRRIRLHDARHTCGTLLHLQGVPVALISAWLGHADAAFTMKVYVHSQPDVLNEVKRYFERDSDEDT